MVSKEDLAWLAGILDGEGTITVFRNTEKNGRVRLCPTINITNTNPKIITKSMQILKKLDVSFHVQERWTDSKRYATCWCISSRNMTTISTVLNSTRPYLYGKGAVADMVLKFIDIRFNNTNKRKPYTAKEHELAEAAMSFNKRGVSKILTDYTQYVDYIRRYKR